MIIAPDMNDTVGELFAFQKFSSFFKEETDLRSVQRVNQRWLLI
jgi:hypothetical protein